MGFLIEIEDYKAESALSRILRCGRIDRIATIAINTNATLDRAVVCAFCLIELAGVNEIVGHDVEKSVLFVDAVRFCCGYDVLKKFLIEFSVVGISTS